MKNLILLIAITFLICTCNKEDEEKLYSINYSSFFTTDSRPRYIAVDDKSGALFLICSKVLNVVDDSRIDKYSPDGEFISTVVDFESFSGTYSHYNPINLFTYKGKKICVLAIPDSELSNTSLSLLLFDFNGTLLKEYLFADGLISSYGTATTMSDKKIYMWNHGVVRNIDVTDGEISDLITPVDSSMRSPWMRPTGMAVNSEGEILLVGQDSINYISEPFNLSHYIIQYNPDDNTLIKKITTDNYCIAGSMISSPKIVVGENDRYYITTFYCEGVKIFNKKGELLTSLDLKIHNERFTFPTDIAVSNHRVYVVDGSNQKVYIYQEN